MIFEEGAKVRVNSPDRSLHMHCGVVLGPAITWYPGELNVRFCQPSINPYGRNVGRDIIWHFKPEELEPDPAWQKAG